MADLKDLEARIRKLEDIEGIKRVKHKYFRSIDQGLWDDVGACFAEEASVFDWGVFPGPAAVARQFKENTAPAYTLFVHQGHNPEIDLTGDTTARGEWELEAFLVTAKTNIGLWITGIYHDEYVKEKGAWKIKSVKLDLFFWSDIEKGWARERFTPMS
jgi:hypothetical protein